LAPSDAGVAPVFSPTSNEIALASGSDIDVWNADQQKLVRSLNPANSISSMLWTPQTLTSFSMNGQIKRWQAQTGTLLSTADTGENFVTAIWRPDGSEVLLLPAETGRMPHIRNTTTGAVISEMCETCVQSHPSGS
jgi:WD40 repeat protein